MAHPIPLTTSNNANVQPDPPRKKTIEETYQKKSQLEHILLRPDTYVGSVEHHTQTLWVFEDGRMVQRPVTFVPGLYKIFDEILVNAADNKQRDPKMDALRVTIDPEANVISVYNNGDGVPVEVHKEEGVYVPELIFGHLLTSSNYDDSVKKTTGGRNGYGAKLSNIFSTEFVIETADGNRQKKYKQVFTENMGKKSDPVITKCKAGENWTKVTFKPDLAKFKMVCLEDDVVALMKKRVVDMAGCLGKTVKVELNGQRVPVKSFQEYVNLYLDSTCAPEAERPKSFYEKVGDRWEVCVSLSEGQFQQVSFVNSIATTKGGTHVDCVTNQIANYVMNTINKKNKNANIKAHNVKSYLWVFVNVLIDNPAFDSQTKETLTLRQSSFGSKCELSEDLLKKVAKSDIQDSLLSWAKFKQEKDLKKTDGTKASRVNIHKLSDANEAGGKNSYRCTLILTEGDSAKSLAEAGISEIKEGGRDYYGVFPLRGKLLNVREATVKQINENKEIQSIKKILGLQQNKQYDSVKSLRYGHLMIMTDQDYDGSHIKGLLINFIHSFWPSLLKIPSFLVEFVTPIVKAVNKKKKGETLYFYTMPEYQSWYESLRGNTSGWTIKYYKGLGTSTKDDARMYFRNIDNLKKDFVWEDEQDGDAIELAFSKKKIEARKNWLRQYEPGTYLDQEEKLIRYSDFINKELILFSIADLQRSIPSMVDGLKPGQRKILFTCFKKNYTHEVKVGKVVGDVMSTSAYHNGDTSLASTIIGMAQNFVGSNNINLLVPDGTFGSRIQGGKDAASPRYISTCLQIVTRLLFQKDDDRILEYLKEDGQSIEPKWYIPIIPMALVNGCEGIGTGWSTFIPNYNPRDIIANLKRMLIGEPMEPMHPWYKGFRGTIEKIATKEGGCSYAVNGVVEEVNETTLRITELPIRRWTDDYRAFLNSVVEGLRDENGQLPKDPFIKDFRNYSDNDYVTFEVVMSEEALAAAKQEGLLKRFKLTSSISTSNMHLFDSEGKIRKFDYPEEILEDFYQLRLDYYRKRIDARLKVLELDLLKMDNRVRFILAVVNEEIIVNNRKRADLFLELKGKGFAPIPKKSKFTEEDPVESNEDDEEDPDNVSEAGVKASDYDYLLSMPISSLTLEKVQQLCADQKNLQEEVETLRRSSPKTLWLTDLDALEQQLDDQDKQEEEDYKKDQLEQAKGGARFKSSRPPPKVPRKTNKKANNPQVSAEAMETSSSSGLPKGETAAGLVIPTGKAKSGKAPIRKEKQPVLDKSDDEDEVESLRDRLKAYTLDSSPDQSTAMDTDRPQPAEKKETKKGRAGRKKQLASVKEISDDEDVIDIDDEEIEVEAVAAPVAGKRGGRKAANPKAAKPPAATKKRVPATKQPKGLGQKLITEMLVNPENAATSPEKKVRKMRESPFNKKSGSILGRVADGSSGSSANADDSEEAIKMPARARPQRANRVTTRYVLSDSDEDKAADDSDFNSEHGSDDSDFDGDE